MWRSPPPGEPGPWPPADGSYRGLPASERKGPGSPVKSALLSFKKEENH